MSEIDDLESRAENEQRLGKLIMENKSGAALAGGIAHLRAAAEAWADANRPSRRAQCLVDLAKLHLKLEGANKAAECYREALSIFESGNDQIAACDAAAGAGKAWRQAGDYVRAQRYLKIALGFSRELNDHIRIAENRLDLARVLTAKGEAYPAIDAASEALQVFDDYRKNTKRAETHAELGAAYMVAEDFGKAADHFQKSADISLEMGRPFEASETLSRYADMEAGRGAYDNAIEILDRCLAMQRQANNRSLMAQTQRLLGMVHLQKGETDRALDWYQHSLDDCRLLEDDAGMARTLYQIGSLHLQGKDFNAALEALTDAHGYAQRSAAQRVNERILAALARIYRQSGAHDQALETMREWVEVLRELGDRQEQLRVIGSIAKVHQERGALEDAEAHLRRLLSVCTRPEDDAERLYAEHGMAVLLSKRGEHRQAQVHFARAVSGYEKHHADRMMGSSMARIRYQYGNCLLRLQRAEEALAQFTKAIADEGESGERSQARILVGMGNACNMLGREDEAREHFERAAYLCEQQGDLRATSIIRRATADATPPRTDS